MKEKKSLKEWLADKTTKAKEFCVKHPEGCLTVLGGFVSLIGGCIKLYASKTEYEDYLYTTVDDQVYKLPAKEMKTCNKIRSEKEEV